MLLKVLCLMMLCHRGVATDDMLDALAGTTGGNRVSLCVGPAAAAGAGAGAPLPASAGERADVMPPGPDASAGTVRCPGVLWRPQWVLTRASCLEQGRLSTFLVVRDAEEGVSCEDFNKGRELLQTHRVCARFKHPGFRRSPDRDLALVAITPPFPSMDLLADTTNEHQLLKEIEPWMEEVLDWDRPLNPDSRFICTPLRMFCTTIVLPFVIFILFFIFMIFFTGPREQIPYKSIDVMYENDTFEDKNELFENENETYENENEMFEKCGSSEENDEDGKTKCEDILLDV